mgnify:CR=1 FL=1
MPSIEVLLLTKNIAAEDVLKECGVAVVDLSGIIPDKKDYSAKHQLPFEFYKAHSYWKRASKLSDSYVVVTGVQEPSAILNFVKGCQEYDDDLVCSNISLLSDAQLAKNSPENTCRRAMHAGHPVYANLNICCMKKRLIEAGIQTMGIQHAHPSIYWPSVVVLEGYKMTTIV